MLGAGALGQPRGMVRGGRKEEGSGWETRVYLWRIHVDIWQNQYNIVRLKKKVQQKLKPGESIDYMEFTIKSSYIVLFVHYVLHIHFISKIYNKHMCICI